MRYILTGAKTVGEVVEIENLHRTCKSVRDSVGGITCSALTQAAIAAKSLTSLLSPSASI
jgi:hypothetical protein